MKLIKVTTVEESYFRCQSCGASKDEKRENINKISIGMEEQHTSSFRLCDSCSDDLISKLLREVNE
ncbi:hypothetical protein BhaS171_00048 [Bacillus phage vB_BhaS-171]|uniref:hypothetical protein n=1 Tax=Bacillus phage vB_BhaS-171 TaxID=1775140 RepID=UPI000744C1F3|nr:hypothetical protein BH781_gp48 [Bacillus phage vB_BhaS-171]ALY08104.1 hypothetical protein BhaS171_00048 [Bacillus phage vB_BhaS-171]